MGEYDPAILRKVADDYRQRALTDPAKAALFVQIATGMEAEACEIESRGPRRPKLGLWHRH